MLQSQELLQGDRGSAVRILQQFPWLLVPDLRIGQFLAGRQKAFLWKSKVAEFQADFVTFERTADCSEWQFVWLASPTAQILQHGKATPEFQMVTEQVTRWHARTRESLAALANRLPHTSDRDRFSYRIVIGDSERQSAEEKAFVRSLRASDVRIRSFRWILEKQQRYSAAELRPLTQERIYSLPSDQNEMKSDEKHS